MLRSSCFSVVGCCRFCTRKVNKQEFYKFFKFILPKSGMFSQIASHKAGAYEKFAEWGKKCFKGYRSVKITVY